MSISNTVAAKKWAHTLEKIKRYTYITVALLVTLGLSYFYYSVLNRPVAGVLWFLAGGLIFFYYWIKWFFTQQPPDPDFAPGKSACPDYLSLVANNSGLYTPATPTQYFCVDYVGVSRNGGIKKMEPSKLSKYINNPAYRFSIDPSVDFTRSGRSAFIQRLSQVGLSYNSIGDNSLPTQSTSFMG